MQKVGLVSLGCPKNLVDSEIVLAKFKENGYSITQDVKEAEIIIINTCGFIEAAKQESINTIIEMAEYKNHNCKTLIAIGCLAQRYRDDILDNIPEIDYVIGVGGYEEVINIISNTNNKKIDILDKSFDRNVGIGYLNSDRLVTTNLGYSYLKIAEGCDNYCSYCIIPFLRGKYRSRAIEDIVEEANKLVRNGTKELILVAQDVTRYGVDLYGSKKLVNLVRLLSEIDNLYGIRLLYCYPEEIDDNLIEEFKNNDKLIKYIDIPIQHASDRILKLMNRKSDSKTLEHVLHSLRDNIPDITIRTTLIVGFPGETQEDFDILKDFVVRNKFDRLGVFTYSREEGTQAYKLKNHVSKKNKELRQNELIQIQTDIDQEKFNNRVGVIYNIIVEGVAEDGIFFFGRSYQEAPEIDNLIYFTSSKELKAGQIVKVKILNNQNMELIGEVIHEFSE